MVKISSLAAMLWLTLLPVVLHGITGSPALDIEQQLRDQFLDPEQEYRISIPETLQPPTGGYDYLRLEPFPGAEPRGSFLVKVRFFKDAEVAQTATVNIRISLYRDVYVSACRVKSKQALDSEMFELVKRDITTLRDQPVESLEEMVDMCAARVIQYGKILTRSMLKREEVIKRGDPVQIEYISGALTITAVGEAKQAGAVGDLIKIKNISSRKIILAEVVDEKSVRIIK